MAKAVPEVVAIFEGTIPADARVERRTMFGCPCAFANGNLFFGTFGDTLLLRLPEAVRADVLATVPGAGPFQSADGKRGMREYVLLPGDIERGALLALVARSFAWILTLPPKERKVKGAPKAKRASKAQAPNS